MSEENKNVELKEEKLQKVAGGSGEGSYGYVVDNFVKLKSDYANTPNIYKVLELNEGYIKVQKYRAEIWAVYNQIHLYNENTIDDSHHPSDYEFWTKFNWGYPVIFHD